MIFSTGVAMLARMINKDMKSTGKLYKVLCNKINLPLENAAG